MFYWVLRAKVWALHLWQAGKLESWKADVISFTLMPNMWLFISSISFNQSKQIMAHQFVIAF